MILSKGNFTLNSVSLINISFSLFPICFIFGNLITNINFLLFCCLGIFYLKSKILIKKINSPIKIIFLFFVIVLFSTSLNLIESVYSGEYEQSDFSRLIKAILFFRFFIVLLIVYSLSELNIINFKFFFISAAFFPVLISMDVIFQYFFNFNFIGMKSYGHHNSSFFGDELIAGGYIQNFSFFSILLLTYLLRNSKNIYKIALTTMVITTIGIGIMLSGNRMPFALFLFGLFLFFFIRKELRKIVLISYFIIFIIFGVIKSSDVTMKNSYNSFYGIAQNTIVTIFKKAKNSLLQKTSEKNKTEDTWVEQIGGSPSALSKQSPEANPYRKLFFTAIETWKSDKIFGNGIKSFRVECKKIIIEQNRGLCSSHPHNYYVEILIDLGIVGFVLTMVFAVIFIVFLVKNYKVLKMSNLQNLFLLAAIISLCLGVFPLKSSGSIFTTNNATYIILLSSIILSYKKLLKGENFG